jgi:hypothetical protein
MYDPAGQAETNMPDPGNGNGGIISNDYVLVGRGEILVVIK